MTSQSAVGALNRLETWLGFHEVACALAFADRTQAKGSDGRFLPLGLMPKDVQTCVRGFDLIHHEITDAEGNPVMDADGRPRMRGEIARIYWQPGGAKARALVETVRAVIREYWPDTELPALPDAPAPPAPRSRVKHAKGTPCKTTTPRNAA